MLQVDYKDGPAFGGLAVRHLDSDQLLPLPNTLSARDPLWSPDGSSIAFRDGSDNRLKLVSASGGPPQQLCDKPAGSFGSAWNRDGIILAGIGPPGTQLMKINTSAGVCSLLPGNSTIERVQPSFLPDGTHFLFHGRPHETDINGADLTGVYVSSFENPAGKRLLPDDTGAIYAPGANGRGFLVFLRDGALVGQAFAPGSLSLSGDLFKIADNVSIDLDSRMMASAAPGVLVYGTGKNFNTQLTWVDRAGKVLSTSGASQAQAGVAPSPDGRQIAVSKDFGIGSNASIWLRDMARGSETRVSSPVLGGQSSVWSPDGKMMVFSGGRDFNLYRRDIANGGKQASF